MEKNNDEKQIIRYLLGDLSKPEQRQVEERILANDEYFDLLLIAEDDLIDDYVSSELSAQERERFEAHFLSTPERRERLRFAMALRNYVSAELEPVGPQPVIHPSWWKQLFSTPALRLAAAVIIIVALGLGAWRVFIYKPEVNKGIAALNDAYREQRPVEARLSKLDYAPFLVTRGDKQEKFDYVARDHAQALIHEEVKEHKNAQSYHDLGLLYLARHEFDKAIDQFKNALKEDSNNAQLHSDLGAAYLERAVAGRDKPSTNDLAESLEYLNRAIEIDNSLHAAYFNKALCLQRMNALVLARQAWEDYLKKDANSEWSKEAERNLQLIQSQGISSKTPEEVFHDFLAVYRQRNEAQVWLIQSQTKEMITETMIPFQLARRLLDYNLSNQTEAGKEMLAAFRFVGELEKKHNGDPFFAELAEFYSVAGAKNAPTLKQAQEALGKGYELCLRGNYREASQHFENSRNLFLKAGDSGESKVVDYWRAYCLSYAGELKKSSVLLSALAEDCQRRRYRWLESQSYSWLANNSTNLSEYSQGVEQDKKALRIAAANNDLYMVQKTSAQVANEYRFLGRLKEALEYNQQSLPSADAYFVSRRQFWRSLYSITETLFALRLYSAAEAYQQDAVQLALNVFNDSALTHSTYRRLGQIYSGQENYPAAVQALEISLKSLQPIEHDPICKRLSALSMLQIGNVKRQMGDYSAALQYYRQAEQVFDSSEFGLHKYNTRKGMLLCYLLNKDEHAIQQELPVVLSLFEQNRQKIKEEQNRNHFFDAEQGVYELAIDYEYGRNNKEEGFHYAELSRARSLQGVISAGATASNHSVTPDEASQPLTLVKLQQSLPDNLKLVEYAVLKNRLIIWLLTKTRFEMIGQPVSMTALESLSNEYLQLLTRNDADSIEREKQLAAELHDWLLTPLEDYLNAGDEVALVPDKFLFKVPFAALFSRRSGLRVVADYNLLYAPSATVLALCSETARMKAQDKAAEKLLAVGNPVSNRQQYQRRSDLPWAAVEAKMIAPFYRTRAVFTGKDALKKQIELEMGQCDVLHFATHYLADDFSPARSTLLLAASGQVTTGESADDLTLQEIQDMRLPRAKLAILSACESGIERYYAGEGLIGLSRSFLMAGIPLVVACQWSVESDSTTDLMIEFHKLRKALNLPTTEALRQAQLSMLSHKDERYHRPYYWAAFFAIGGHASY